MKNCTIIKDNAADMNKGDIIYDFIWQSFLH